MCECQSALPSTVAAASAETASEYLCCSWAMVRRWLPVVSGRWLLVFTRWPDMVSIINLRTGKSSSGIKKECKKQGRGYLCRAHSDYRTL
jgi:hypothetical protein